MIVLGIDPGYRTGGWALVRDFPETKPFMARFTPELIDCGFFVPVPRIKKGRKTDEIAEAVPELDQLISRLVARRFPDAVSLVAVEHYTPTAAWGGGGGGSSGYRPAWVEGVIEGLVEAKYVEMVLLRPDEVRQHFLGKAERKTKANPSPTKGDRSKGAMERALIERLKLGDPPWLKLAKFKRGHVADAVALAVCAADRAGNPRG